MAAEFNLVSPWHRRLQNVKPCCTFSQTYIPDASPCKAEQSVLLGSPEQLIDEPESKALPTSSD